MLNIISFTEWSPIISWFSEDHALVDSTGSFRGSVFLEFFKLRIIFLYPWFLKDNFNAYQILRLYFLSLGFLTMLLHCCSLLSCCISKPDSVFLLFYKWLDLLPIWRIFLKSNCFIRLCLRGDKSWSVFQVYNRPFQYVNIGIFLISIIFIEL